MISTRRPEYPIHPLFINRWSPRAFTNEAIPEAALLTLLEAARWAPSSYNAQPWRFIYALRDTEDWQPIFDALVEFNQGWAKRAAALVVVASARESERADGAGRESNPWHSFDAGAAWASLAFQATLSGLAAHAMAGFDPDRLRQATGLPEGYAIEAVVAVGRRDDKDVLDEDLQAMEFPNERLPLAGIAMKGRFLPQA